MKQIRESDQIREDGVSIEYLVRVVQGVVVVGMLAILPGIYTTRFAIKEYIKPILEQKAKYRGYLDATRENPNLLIFGNGHYIRPDSNRKSAP